jgi:hypothetical protein
VDDGLRQLIYARSQGRCEVFVEYENSALRGRCTRKGMEIHHMVTKARGGVVLDNAYETAHLIHLCREHHAWSDGKQAYDAGLLIEGYVTTDKQTGRPKYLGPDPELRRLYP